MLRQFTDHLLNSLYLPDSRVNSLWFAMNLEYDGVLRDCKVTDLYKMKMISFKTSLPSKTIE